MCSLKEFFLSGVSDFQDGTKIRTRKIKNRNSPPLPPLPSPPATFVAMEEGIERRRLRRRRWGGLVDFCAFYGVSKQPLHANFKLSDNCLAMDR